MSIAAGCMSIERSPVYLYIFVSMTYLSAYQIYLALYILKSKRMSETMVMSKAN